MANFSFDIKVSVQIFPQKLNNMLNSPTGVAGQTVKNKADTMLQKAQQKVGQKTGNRYSGHHPDREKRLAQSGRVVSIGGASWMVEFVHPAAFVHHEGAGPHSISPTKDHGKLYNPRDPARTEGGKFAARGTVMHDGHEGNPFLIEAAAEVGLKPSGALRRGKRLAPVFRVPGIT